MTTKQQNPMAVVGVFRNRMAADECFSGLISRGYLSSDVNIMMSERTRLRDYAWEPDAQTHPGAEVAAMNSEGGGTATAVTVERKNGTTAGSMATEGIGIGGSIGTAVGVTLAAIATVGTSLLIPGLNLIVAGPVLAALAGGGAGALAGGLVGGLVGLGIPEQDAQVYNAALQEGGVVMSVTAHSDEDAAEVKDLMVQQGGEQVTYCNC
jgi:hypothetical protein